MVPPFAAAQSIIPSGVDFTCRTTEDVDSFNENILDVVKQHLGPRAKHPAYANRPVPRLTLSEDGAVFVSVGDKPVGVSKSLPVTVHVTPANTYNTTLI